MTFFFFLVFLKILVSLYDKTSRPESTWLTSFAHQRLLWSYYLLGPLLNPIFSSDGLKVAENTITGPIGQMYHHTIKAV